MVIEEKLGFRSIDTDANGISFRFVASPDIAYEKFGLSYPNAKGVEVIIELMLCYGEISYECYACPLIFDTEGVPVDVNLEEIKLKKKGIELLLYKALYEVLQKEELLNLALSNLAEK